MQLPKRRVNPTHLRRWLVPAAILLVSDEPAGRLWPLWLIRRGADAGPDAHARADLHPHSGHAACTRHGHGHANADGNTAGRRSAHHGAASQPTHRPPTASPLAAPRLTITGDLVNVRSGPATDFDLIGSATQGQTFTVVAKNAEGDWWQVCCIDEQPGWVFGELATVENGAAVAVAADLPAAASTEAPAAEAPTAAAVAEAPTATPPAADTPAPAPAAAYDPDRVQRRQFRPQRPVSNCPLQGARAGREQRRHP